ncbi:MAG: helix-hairpin-helix domain-containing protein [Candidatus Bathyarchaeia archaeon]
MVRELEPSAKTGREEIVELTEVKGIGPKTAEKLREAGIENASDLADSNPETIAKALSLSEERSSSLIEDARSLLKRA